MLLFIPPQSLNCFASYLLDVLTISFYSFTVETVEYIALCVLFCECILNLFPLLEILSQTKLFVLFDRSCACTGQIKITNVVWVEQLAYLLYHIIHWRKHGVEIKPQIFPWRGFYLVIKFVKLMYVSSRQWYISF